MITQQTFASTELASTPAAKAKSRTTIISYKLNPIWISIW